MKISSSALSFLDAAAAGGSPKGVSDYGIAFEAVIRDVADGSAKPGKPGKKDAHGPKDADALKTPQAKGDAGKAGEKADAEIDAADKADAGDAANTDDAADAADASLPSSEAAGSAGTAPGGGSATLDMLGRLLAATDAMAFQAGSTEAVPTAPGPVEPKGSKGAGALAEGRPPQGRGEAPAFHVAPVDDGAPMIAAGLEEPIVVGALDPAPSSAGVDDAAPAQGKVRLEVLHMETHFEPRSDAFVLVEGSAGAKASPPAAGGAVAAVSGADEGADVPPPSPRVSFDEALQRLSARQGGGGDATGEDRGGRRDAREDTVAARPAAFGRPAPAPADARAVERSVGPVPVAARAPENEAGIPAIASMTGQVAGRVIDALMGDAQPGKAPSDLPPSDTHLRMKAGGGALKTLTIQLQPENLGRLDVSMRLVEGQLTLELAATEAGTARVLAADRDGLKKLLEHAGFSLDDASITIVTRDGSLQTPLRGADGSATPQDAVSRGAAGSGGASTGDGRSPPQSGSGAQSGAQSGGRGDGSNRRAVPREDAGARTAPRSSSVYL